MELRTLQVRTISLKRAPSQAPCPTCGRLGRCTQDLHHRVRTISYQQVVFLDITYSGWTSTTARWTQCVAGSVGWPGGATGDGNDREGRDRMTAVDHVALGTMLGDLPELRALRALETIRERM
jgi:hypothetical protein